MSPFTCRLSILVPITINIYVVSFVYKDYRQITNIDYVILFFYRFWKSLRNYTNFELYVIRRKNIDGTTNKG